MSRVTNVCVLVPDQGMRRRFLSTLLFHINIITHWTSRPIQSCGHVFRPTDTVETLEIQLVQEVHIVRFRSYHNVRNVRKSGKWSHWSFIYFHTALLLAWKLYFIASTTERIPCRYTVTEPVVVHYTTIVKVFENYVRLRMPFQFIKACWQITYWVTEASLIPMPLLIYRIKAYLTLWINTTLIM